MRWSNERLPIATGAVITEYDIRHGNTSIMTAFKLKSPETIKSLDSLPKHERNVAVGNMMREDREFAKALEAGFNEAVASFIKANDLDPDIDIVEIRRDAIFVINRHVPYLSFASGAIHFVPKDTYKAMIRFDNNITFFVRHSMDGPKYKLDGIIKPGDDRDALIEKLTPGPLSLMEEFLEAYSSACGDRFKIYRWMNNIVDMYKRKMLDIEYYREFNRDAAFRIGDTLFDSADDSMLDELDITYNFINVIRPILEIIV